MPNLIAIAKTSDLRTDSGLTVQVKGRLIALFLWNDKVYATDDACPHMGASLGEGSVCDGVVTCPWHAWRFNIATGGWADLPGSPPRLNTYTAKVEGGAVLLDVTW